MRARIAWASMVCAASLSVAGCSKPCDEAALEEVAETFETKWAEDRQPGFEALGKACPGLPPSLGTALMTSYGRPSLDLRMQRLSELEEDQAYIAIRDAFCALDDAEQAAIGQADDPNAALREACKLDASGLIAADEPFDSRDVTAAILHHWLVEHRIDPMVARRLARSLMIAGDSEEQLGRRCAENQKRCGPWIAAIGIELPKSTSVWPTGGVPIFIKSDALEVGADEVMALQDGKPANGEFESHLSPKLLAQFEPRTKKGRDFAAKIQDEWRGELTVFANATTEFGVIVDTLFTAHRAGYREYNLAVAHGNDLYAHRVTGGVAWEEPTTGYPEHRPPRLTVRVHRDGIELVTNTDEPQRFAVRGSCIEDPGGCFDGAAVAARVREVLESERSVGDDELAFFVDRDVPLQVLTAAMDAGRGSGCLEYGGYPGETPDCLEWKASVNASPPLFFQIDRVAQLELSGMVSSNRRYERSPNYKRRDPLPEQLAARYETAKAEIRECLVQDPWLLAEIRPDTHVVVIVGPHPERPKDVVARMMRDGPVGRAFETCVLGALDIEPAAPGMDAFIDHVSSGRMELHFRPRFGAEP